ncbi:hypothetical protein CQW23_35301 [Capsicum baccatum]|uniref:Uncharacterized protein n=1 Tax=Capsicum baccatum TaxID=33114 RepID=A0A2G2UWE2_CAPBA|nr:hypothetical protein CQW23_35301 [Capsicum baccatum]
MVISSTSYVSSINSNATFHSSSTEDLDSSSLINKDLRNRSSSSSICLSIEMEMNMASLCNGNVRTYYQQFEAQLNQSLIDQKVKEHLGAFRPVGLPFPQLRPGMPGLPPPQMQMPGNPQMPAGAQWVPGMRPPVLPRPMPGLPGINSIENS